jgi:hypothetical protein
MPDALSRYRVALQFFAGKGFALRAVSCELSLSRRSTFSVAEEPAAELSLQLPHRFSFLAF